MSQPRPKSKPGVVLDPFCGSGTTLVAAHRLGRDWIGFDNNAYAIAITERRLLEEGAEFQVICQSPEHEKELNKAREFVRKHSIKKPAKQR